LTNNNAKITKADKGNSIVIIYNTDYINKINNFLEENYFSNIPNDPTEKFQKSIIQRVHNCNLVIKKSESWKLFNMNPKDPSIKGLTEIHKQNNPIRPIVNWQEATAYKLSKHLTRTLTQHLHLPDSFSVKNSITLMNELNSLKTNHQTKLCSFDIKKMYANTPRSEFLTIIKQILTQCNELHIQEMEQTLTLITLILNQNYFYHDKKYYEQTNVLAMGAPTSALFADIFLQHIEHNFVISIISKRNILYYCRYVDDILILYNEENSNIVSILDQFNNISPSLDFTCEIETNNSLNFLVITIKKNINHELVFSIYRKPSATDTIINFQSSHPPEHKNLAVKYLTDRAQNYPLQKESKERECLIIKHILNSNGYPQNFINKKTLLKTNNRNEA
jgi:hypothetical protein